MYFSLIWSTLCIDLNKPFTCTISMKAMAGIAVEDDFLSQLDNIQTQDLIFALDQPMVESAETPSSEKASSARFSNVSAMDNSEVIFPVIIT